MGLCCCLSGDAADSSGLPLLTGNENSLIYRLLSPLNPFLEIKINMQFPFPSAPDIPVKWQSIVRGCTDDTPLQHRASTLISGCQQRQCSPKPHLKVVLRSAQRLRFSDISVHTHAQGTCDM